MKSAININIKGDISQIFLSDKEIEIIKKDLPDLKDPMPFYNNILTTVSPKIQQLMNNDKIQIIKLEYHNHNNILLLCACPESWCYEDILELVKKHGKNARATFINKRHTIAGNALFIDLNNDLLPQEFQETLYRKSFRFNIINITNLECKLLAAQKLNYDLAPIIKKNIPEITNKETEQLINGLNNTPLFYFKEREEIIKKFFHGRIVGQPMNFDARKKLSDAISAYACQSRTTNEISKYVDACIQELMGEVYILEPEYNGKIPKTEQERRLVRERFISNMLNDYIFTYEDAYILLNPYIERIYVIQNKHFYVSFSCDTISEGEMIFVQINKGSEKNMFDYTWDAPDRTPIPGNFYWHNTSLMKEQVRKKWNITYKYPFDAPNDPKISEVYHDKIKKILTKLKKKKHKRKSSK